MKNKGIMTVLDAIAVKNYGRTLTNALDDKVCVMCGEKVLVFRDDLSKKEYFISGMCQSCQDKVFNEGG